MSTSSEDEPNLAQLFGHQSQHTADRSDESDLPDWIQSHTTVKQHPIDVSSDHEDIDIDAGRSRAAGAGTTGAAAAAADTEQGGRDEHAAAAPSGKQPAGKAGSSSAAAAAAVPIVAAATDRSEVQVVLPEKLIRHKVLIELEPAPHQATELSGDAGAVGRLVASAATAEDGHFKLDLKGVLYQATVMPLAGTALVVNIGPTEAKVESIMNDFVRLREESSYHDTGMSLEGGYGMAELMADDEDNYQVAGAEGKEGGEKTAAKQAAAAAKCSKAGTSKPPSSRALKPAKAGVKKKPAKSKATGKGSKATPKKAKATPKSKATPKPAAKPKPAKKKKKQDSDDEDDWDGSDYSE